jgi:hypothetical protein
MKVGQIPQHEIYIFRVVAHVLAEMPRSRAQDQQVIFKTRQKEGVWVDGVLTGSSWPDPDGNSRHHAVKWQDGRHRDLMNFGKEDTEFVFDDKNLGEKVTVCCHGEVWYPGTIVHITASDLVAVQFDDGDWVEDVPVVCSYMRYQQTVASDMRRVKTRASLKTFKVKAIVGFKKISKVPHYRIEWQKSGAQTWEPVANIVEDLHEDVLASLLLIFLVGERS